MKRILTLLAVIVFIASTVYSAEKDKSNTYSSPTAGFSIIKPADWRFGSLEQVSASRESVRLEDKKLEKMIRERVNAPLVVIYKYEEPYPDLNPSVQVLVRPLGELEGKSPVEILSLILPVLERAMADFEVLEPAKKVKVSGLDAAYIKIKYTFKTENGSFPAISRLWLVPRGTFMFMIGMAGPQEGPDVSEKEFAGILKSIKIEK